MERTVVEILAVGVRHVDGVVVCLVVGGLFERVGAVVGFQRNGSDGVWRWCGVGEKKRKRSGEKERLYARAGTQSGSHGAQVQAGTRHHLDGEGRHVKLGRAHSLEWQSLTACAPSSTSSSSHKHH